MQFKLWFICDILKHIKGSKSVFYLHRLSLCLSICLPVANITENNFWMDCHDILSIVGKWYKEQMEIFLQGSGSRSGHGILFSLFGACLLITVRKTYDFLMKF